MKLKQLRVGAFKGQTFDRDVADAVLLVGPNGSGKTAMLQAATVAVLGYEPRLGKRPGDTMQLASNGTMFVEAKFGDDFNLCRTFNRDKRGAVSQTVDCPSPIDATNTDRDRIIAERVGSMPMLFNPAEFLALSPDKRRAALAPYMQGDGFNLGEFYRACFAESVGAETLRTLFKHAYAAESFGDLSDAQKDAFTKKVRDYLLESGAEDAIGRLGSFSPNDGVDAILAKMVSTASENVNAARAEIRRHEQAAEALAAQAAEARAKSGGIAELRAKEEAIAAELAEVRKELGACEEINRAAIRRQKRLDELHALIESAKAIAFADDADECDERRDRALKAWADNAGAEWPDNPAIGAEIAEQTAVMGAESAAMYEITGRQTAIKEEIDRAADKTPCPNCGWKASSEEEITAKRDELARLEIEWKRHFDAQLLARKRIEAAEATAAELYGAVRTAKERAGRIAEAKAKLADLEAEKLRVMSEAQGIETSDMSLIHSRIAALTAALEKARQAHGEAVRAHGIIEGMEKAVASASGAQKRLEAAQVVLRAAKAMRDARVNEIGAKLTGAANELLTAIRPGLSLSLVLEDAKGSAIFDFALKIDGVDRPVSALSGGETILAVGVALATAIINLANPPLRMLLIEAAEVDGANLAGMLGGLRAMIAGGHLDNVMVATCHDVTDADGWQVIRLGNNQEKEAVNQ